MSTGDRLIFRKDDGCAVYGSHDNEGRMRTGGLLVITLLVLPPAARAQTCPAVIEGATRLALISADSMQTSAAKLALYNRDSRAAPRR